MIKVWFHNLGKITTDNEIQYIIPINQDQGSIMISYSDNIYADYWNMIDKLGYLDLMISQKLNEIFPDISIPKPKYISCFYWKEGSHYFKPGINSDNVIKQIAKPFLNKEIYICNEAYSEHQAWVEGSLKSANNCMDMILNN